jgi:hypothetical protein
MTCLLGNTAVNIVYLRHSDSRLTSGNSSNDDDDGDDDNHDDNTNSGILSRSSYLYAALSTLTVVNPAVHTAVLPSPR